MSGAPGPPLAMVMVVDPPREWSLPRSGPTLSPLWCGMWSRMPRRGAAASTSTNCISLAQILG